MMLRIVVDVPDIVGELLASALADGPTAVICPETIYPGYVVHVHQIDRVEVSKS